jgi:hypothetical protein
VSRYFGALLLIFAVQVPNFAWAQSQSPSETCSQRFWGGWIRQCINSGAKTELIEACADLFRAPAFVMRCLKTSADVSLVNACANGNFPTADEGWKWQCIEESLGR